MNLLAVLLALIVVFGAIVLDHFKGPLFPDVLYSHANGDQQSRDVTVRRPSPMDREDD